MMRRTLLVVVAVLALAAILLGADFLLHRDRLHHGVTIWSVPLDGVTRSAAGSLLQEEAAMRLGRSLDLVAPASSEARSPELAVTSAQAGFTLDTEATLAAGLVVGRGSLPASLVSRVATWFKRVEVQPVLRVDEAAWQEVVDLCALTFGRLPKEGSLALVSGEPKAIAAEYGISVQEEVLRERFEEALLCGDATLEVPLEQTEPAVSTEEARAALAAARTALAAPLTLSYREQEYVLSVDEIASIIAVNAGGLTTGRPVTFATEAAVDTLETVLAGVEEQPSEAEIIPGADGRGFTVSASRDGTEIEWEALLAALERAALETTNRRVPIPTTVAHPKLTTEDAEQLGTRRVVASFRTFFSPAATARAHNIRQVASLLDGHVVKPGEVFSFNDAVGQRTKAAGFDEAPVISGGVLTQGVGGGICQVSTTLFNAVFFAGLPVVERWPHTFYIDHYPVGRDATVSYGSQDFRFRNDTEQVVLVSCSSGESWVEVVLSAASWNRRIDYETQQVGELLAPASTPEHPRLLQDPALAEGARSDLEPGVGGRKILITRRVFDLSGALLTEDTFESAYNPKDFVVRVGV